ncbi:MAG: type I 3-dehydroquinate dehydratase [Actinomyces graevenitzii]|jgi:3-dehydroquinate dehydratase, type I|uniref:3-dehydroquinate dehydratase n=1 Tax=Actinomyces graevenitzii TaxID=55565 RepID=A0A9E7DCZ4_9ACTO|nr:type I 3-dehydroquinate dehydratase [Actinomyces graevenitzii]UQF79530.1 MAG: type I 3-dehydroquinate dehydratase [Actinomyces graevenitzii]
MNQSFAALLLAARRERQLVIATALTDGAPSGQARQARLAQQQGAGAVELRADLLADPAQVRAALTAVRAASSLPLLLTYRSATEGGKGAGHGQGYEDYLASLLQLRPAVAAVDIEMACPASKALVAEAKAGGYDVVGSCHDFTATPSAAQITQKLAQITAAGADITKVAYMPRTAQDVAALRHAAHDFAGAYPHQPLIAISMGQLGAPSRTDLVNCLTFATIADGAASAPGQATIAYVRAWLENTPGTSTIEL